MKSSLLSLSIQLLVSCLLLSGCQPFSQQNPATPQPTPASVIVPVTVVDADSSDKPSALQLDSSPWDISTNLYVEENYPLTERDYAFTLSKGYYMAQIRGRDGIYDSRINGRYMCINSHNDCDSTRSKAASLWDRIGQITQPRRLSWSFTDQQKKQGYQFRMNALPTPVQVVSVPDTIRQTADNVVRLGSFDSRDSLLVEFMFLQPDEPSRKRVIPFINYSKIHLVVKPVNNEIRIPSSYLKPIITYFNMDLVRQKIYLNVSSIRQVIKQVGTQKVMLTYQVSNWQPVILR